MGQRTNNDSIFSPFSCTYPVSYYINFFQALQQRSVGSPGLNKAGLYIAGILKRFGYDVEKQKVKVFKREYNSKDLTYITVESMNIIGRKECNKGKCKKLIFCAHYDAYDGTPGANDNASGVISLLVLADLLKEKNFPYNLNLCSQQLKNLIPREHFITYGRSAL